MAPPPVVMLAEHGVGHLARIRIAWVRISCLAALMAAATAAALLLDFPSLATMQHLAGQAGPAAFAGFILGYALLTLAPVPRAALSVAAGVLFGWFTGAVLVWTASLFGAALGFGLGRHLGRGAVQRWAGARVRRLDRALTGRGISAVMVGRLLPVVPFTAVNYLAGMSGVRFRHFITGTALGVIPGTVSYVGLGTWGSRPATWEALIAATLVLAAALAGVRAARRRHGRPASGRPPSPDERAGLHHGAV